MGKSTFGMMRGSQGTDPTSVTCATSLHPLPAGDLSEPSGGVGAASVQKVGATPFTFHVQLLPSLAN